MIGSLVEYTGIYKSLRGKRAIVVKEVPSVFRRTVSSWEVKWIRPVEFAGRRVSGSTFAPSEFKIVSGGNNESK